MASSDVSLGQVHEAELTLRKAGATSEFWTRIAQDEELARKVVEFVNQRPCFKVVVDYSKSLAEMIAAGKYDRADADITQDHFPVKGEGQQEVEVVLFHFKLSLPSDKSSDKRGISSDYAIAEMDKAGHRDARIEELLALGSSQKDLQKQFAIAALGSVWQDPGGHRSVPYLGWGGGRERGLGLRWLWSGWESDFWFAGVRK